MWPQNNILTVDITKSGQFKQQFLSVGFTQGAPDNVDGRWSSTICTLSNYNSPIDIIFAYTQRQKIRNKSYFSDTTYFFVVSGNRPYLDTSAGHAKAFLYSLVSMWDP